MFILKNRNQINYIFQQTFRKLSCGEMSKVILYRSKEQYKNQQGDYREGDFIAI